MDDGVVELQPTVTATIIDQAHVFGAFMIHARRTIR